MTTPQNRHLLSSKLREYIDEGAAASVVISGEPAMWLVIEPRIGKIALRQEGTIGRLPDLTKFEHLSASSLTTAEGQRLVEFAVSGSDILVQAYPALCEVADLVQNGVPFDHAVEQVVGSFQELLRNLGRLSDDQEIGLFGELLVLSQLIDAVGSTSAVASWRGSDAEEHDFGLSDLDVEVKTTTAERRRHWIGSATQLVASPGRSLCLLSLQVTGAGDGGLSLSELVERTRGALGADRSTFDSKLNTFGWSDDQAERYRKRFRFRSNPNAYNVTPEFPGLTPGRLLSAGISIEQIPEIRYVLDLTGMSPSPLPEVLIDLGSNLK
jgi:Putative  PD-(D/E)XK family member, (DUF4420)